MLRQFKLIHYSARAICVCFSCTPILRRSSSAYMDKEMDENLTFCFIYFIRIRGGEVPLRKSPFGRPFLCSGDQSVFEEGSVMYSWMICCFLFLWCSNACVLCCSVYIFLVHIYCWVCVCFVSRVSVAEFYAFLKAHQGTGVFKLAEAINAVVCGMVLTCLCTNKH